MNSARTLHGNNYKQNYHIVSFSGGKDSTAMLLRMVELGMKIDMIIFCDTGIEFDEMYHHIKKVEDYIGLPITTLQAKYSFEHLLLDHVVTKRNGEKVRGYSFPTPRIRWCTSKLKIDVFNKHIKELEQKYNVIRYVGIAFDERHRIKDFRYPLVEWGWTEKDCLNYCYKKGFDFGGLYEIFNRVSCWCCPLQPLSELRKLRKYFPEKWELLLNYQSKTWRTFKPTFSVQELEIRFQLEEERESQGLTINSRTKEFRNALDEALAKIKVG